MRFRFVPRALLILFPTQGREGHGLPMHTEQLQSSPTSEIEHKADQPAARAVEKNPMGHRGPRSGGSHSRAAMIRLRVVNVLGVTLPFVGLITAIWMLWGVAFNWTYLAILGGMYFLTAIGITVGYHRYFTHQSFKTKKPVAAVLGVLGSMALEGPVIDWVAVHRCHHQHSDDEHDPHSPHTHGAGLWSAIRGMWHAHMGWFMSPNPRGLERYVPDLNRDRTTVMVSKLFPLWAVLGLAIPAALGGLLTMSWMGVLLGFLWGGLVRIFLVHHVTWSVNSVCHIWGTRPYRSHDHSRNNAIFGVLAMGEGWHNNHHAFPTSARHGLQWWQLDISYLVIKAMALAGLASEVRVPSAERVLSKRAVAGGPPGDA